MSLDTDSCVIEVHLKSDTVDNGVLRIVIDATETNRESKYIADGVADLLQDFFKKCELDMTMQDVS